MSQPEEHGPEFGQESPADAVPAAGPSDAPATSRESGEVDPAIAAVESAPDEAPAATGTAEVDATKAVSSDSDTDFPGILQSLAVTIVIAVFVITFIVQAFQIPSESMENTLLIGDYLLVDKAHYGPGGTWSWLLPYRPVKRDDIVVFRYPVHPSQHFVKRVIGVPGDRVRLIKKHVFVNGVEVAEPFAVYKRHDRDSFRDNFPTGDSLSPSIEAAWYLELRRLTDEGQLIVPAGFYFVMGDNREESLDSRYWGFVPQENIIGRPLLIYWSVERRALDDDEETDAASNAPSGGKLTRFGHAVINTFRHMRWHRTLRLVY